MIPAEATTEGQSLMIAILGGAVGAVIALVGTLFVHLVIVPRVDARRRREERWEQDVLNLGGYLTDVVGERARAAESTAGMVVFWASKEVEEATDPEGRKEALARAKRDSREVSRAFDECHARVRWLCDRVTGFNTAVSDLMVLGIAASVWERRAMLARMQEYMDDVDPDQLSNAWTSERKTREALVDKVKHLALGSAPRATLRERVSDFRHRAGQRLHRLMSKLRKTDPGASGDGTKRASSTS